MILNGMALPELRPMLPRRRRCRRPSMILAQRLGRPARVARLRDEPAGVRADGRRRGRRDRRRRASARRTAPVGWIGTIFVAPAWRGQGLGRAITQAIIDRLEAAGCRTLVLVATAEGRRLYERMGFEIQTRYRILEAPGLCPASAATAGAAGRSGRSRLTTSTRCRARSRRQPARTARTPAALRDAGHGQGPRRAGWRRCDGFVIRAPWGGGATIARSLDAALGRSSRAPRCERARGPGAGRDARRRTRTGSIA